MALSFIQHCLESFLLFPAGFTFYGRAIYYGGGPDIAVPTDDISTLDAGYPHLVIKAFTY